LGAGALVLALAVVGSLSFVYFLDHLAGRWNATRVAGMACVVAGVSTHLVSGSLRRNRWLWTALIVPAIAGLSYGFQWFGWQHQGQTTAIGLFALSGALVGVGIRMFYALEPLPPVLPTNRWRPVRDRDWDKELKDALTDIATSPQRFEAGCGNAAALLWHLGRRTQAFEIMDEAVRRFPSAHSHALRAGYLMQSDRNLEALTDLDQVVELQTNPDLLFLSLLDRAELLSKLRKFERALADASRMTKLRPQDSLGYAARADAHEALGMIEAANRDRDQFRKLRDIELYRNR
jgi:tetratricopeptide (TPR) repeat protein